MNMKNILYKFSLLFLVLSFSACQDSLVPEKDIEKPVDITQSSVHMPWIPGQAFVKLSKDVAGNLNIAPSSKASENNSSAETYIANLLSDIFVQTRTQDLEITPVFNIQGEYASAMRREGLDRWYKVTFSKDLDVQKVVDKLSADREVEAAHGDLKIEQTKYTYTPVSSSELNELSGNSEIAPMARLPHSNNGYPGFANSDPLLVNQWHYQNQGTVGTFERGADINLFFAWNKTTGSSDVVVAVMDSGIDTSHEDLQGSFWTDGEGHYGKNFLKDNFEMDYGFHGTHVAGTIGARSNNGIGVAGVAGGDGTSESGVRLMSCQIFGPDRQDGSAESAGADKISKAFIWAAENGANIVNCSWGYPWSSDYTAEEYKEAYEKASALISEGIDFFIKYAGNDKDGKQKPGSRMSGGIVVFASGNDSARDVEIVPAANPNVISVAAFKHNFELAEYSNTGSWVDILAPGGYTGGYEKLTGILSTVPKSFEDIQFPGGVWGYSFCYPGNTRYAFAQGTSMATPHVSGIAALMVSRFGENPGYTNKELRKRLLNSIKARDFYEYNLDPTLKGKVGVGYVDAGIAVNDPEKVAPEAPSDLSTIQVNYYDAKVSWSVTSDTDASSGIAFAYDVYISTDKNAELKEPVGEILTYENGLGSKLEYEFTKLESNTTYYVSVIARDRSDNVSAPAVLEFKTKLNYAPEIVNMPEGLISIIDTKPYYVYRFKVEDKDENQKWDYFVENLPEGASIERQGEELVMTVIVDGVYGLREFNIRLVDDLGGESITKVQYEILSYDPPQLIADFSKMAFQLGDKPVQLDLSEYFEFSSGTKDAVEYEVSSSNENVASVELINEYELKINPISIGSTSILLTVNDGVRMIKTTIDVIVSDKDAPDVYALYPIPAHSYIKLLVRSKVESLNVKVTSVRGEVLIEKKVPVNKKTMEAALSVDKLNPGVYNLIIKSESSTSRRTFLKN